MDRSKHKVKAHGENRVTEKREFKCASCKETFPSIMRRRTHLLGAHGITEPYFKCEDCGKNFQTAIRLTLHDQLCLKKKNWIADDTVPKGWKFIVTNCSNMAKNKVSSSRWQNYDV